MSKQHAPKYVVLLLLVLLATLSLSGIASAQQSGVSPSRAGLTPAALLDISNSSVRLADGRIQVIVTLSAEPAVTAFINAGGRANRAAADTAAAAQAGVVAAQQSTFRTEAGIIGAEVASSTGYLVNTVTVRINPSQVAALNLLTGVVRIDPDRIYEREDTVSVPFMGADEVWTGIGGGTGYTGNGTVVAVLDTGIDYIHTDFGGSGDYADNPDTTVGDDSDFFPAAFPIVAPGDPKVVGGYDYVGDDYDASEPATNIPVPDADPIDCPIVDGGGHGSHVAGTAAGWGVNADGSTYAGPFDNTIFTDFPGWTAAFRIGPGVAPEAALLAMRIFGCNGSVSTSIIIEAIEDSVAGTYGPVADVINMSLGSAYGYQDPAGPDNVAIANATAAGTAVVMSAGNNGDFFFISGSPGAANTGISVASSVDLGNQARGVKDDSTSTIYAAAYGASSPFFHDVVTAVSQRPSPNADGCLASDFAGFTPGNIALIDRGTCAFAVKQDNAFAAGAAGVVVANVASSPSPESLVTMAAATAPGYNLPTVHVGFTNGEALRSAVDGTNTITMDSALGNFVVEVGDTISSFTSRGPVRDSQGSFKPDLAAPGNTILSAGSGSGNQTYNISGTSMASPHIAGSMALLMEKYPTWSVEDLKALIINTANNPLSNGVNEYGPQRVGSGRVDLEDTFGAGEVIAYNTANKAGVSVSFGYPEVVAGGTLNETRTITLENKSAAQVDYTVSFDQGTDMVGVALGVTETTVSVPANGTATVTVTLTGDPNVANVNTNSDPTLGTAGRHYLTEESGLVIFTPTAGSTVPLRVAVYAAPRVNSDMAGTLTASEITTLTGTGTIDLAGTDVETGATSNDILSVVTAFELVASSSNEANTPDIADVQYFGIANDYAITETGDGQVYFAVATYGDWNTPNQVLIQVNIDFDFDGVADFAVINDTATGALDTLTVEFVDLLGLIGDPGDVFSYGTNYVNGLPGDVLNTYAFNNNVMFMPIFMEDLLFGGAFNYWVETYASRFEDPTTEELLLVDSIASADAPLFYDPSAGGYTFNGVGGFPAFADLDATQITFSWDLTNLVPENEVPDILLLHHHNAASAGRAEVLDVTTPAVSDFALTAPADGALVTDPSTVTAITWTPATNATAYNFYLFKLSGNTRLDAGEYVILEGLTPAADEVDPLTCDTTTCTLTVDAALQAELTDGLYSWTVEATSDFDEVEASNAPFDFKVNTGDIELLANGGFETAGATAAAAEGWTLKNKSGDKRKVDAEKANSGEAYFLFKGKAGDLPSSLVQNANLDLVGVGANDVVTASIFANTALTAGAKLQVKITYSETDAGANGNGKDKIVVNLASTTDYQLFTGSLTADGTITKMKYQVKFSSTSGKLSVDDASLVREGAASGLEGRGDGLVPLPSGLGSRK